MPLQADLLNAQMHMVFASYLNEDEPELITIEVQHGGKHKAAVVEGRIVGVYAYGVLFQGPYAREFLSYVDFYTGHVRVRSGAAKTDLAALLPELYNLVLMTVRERPRRALARI